VSWHFSQEPGADYWRRLTSSDGTPSAESRSTTTAGPSSCNVSETDSCPSSQSGTTSAPSTGDRGAGSSTLSPAGSPARTSQAPGPVEGWTAIARAYGLRCSVSLARYGLRMSLPKTLRCSAFADWTSSSQGLPTWGLMRHGACSELGTLAHPTDETGCGSLLPTPTGAGNEGSPSMQKWPAHRALRAMLPTPVASDRNGDRQRGAGSLARGGGRRLTVDMLPTPTATLYGSNQGGAAGRTGAKRQSLEGRTGGVFIALREWMMGWPLGWSASGPLATDRFRLWLRSHGASCPTPSELTDE
jgi:hypothetical protein